MGIPSYFSHFVRQHRKIIKPIKLLNKPINNLYLDCNAFIYDGVNNDKTINKATKEYALNVLAELKKILDKTFPPTIYNTSSKVFTKLKLNTIKEQNIYNEKI